ncbi:glycosyltransferase [Phytoactinopolyspora halotolerans]|uniref:Glycosyltransferase n=1 Tax=Phytoactinopolyspora halotolerans TaxID=1981512 RepID=A0A6L9SHW4_9ACTN|nr:glycosyltransferase [Phytoactinopolyspora halotolerans]NEE03921.1 glycosyltransferase [Phytoactinopolyspora halotolerans]
MNHRVIYAIPDITVPTGGVRVLYRHIEILSNAGYRAYAWYRKRILNHDWFSSAVRTISSTTLELGDDDLLVVPEPWVVSGIDPAPGCRKVIYNQNHFYTFFSAPPVEYPVWRPRPAVWVSSLANRDAQLRLKDLLHVSGVEYIPLSIDTSLFRPTRKERKVSWMPRKRPNEGSLLHALLDADERMAGVTLMPIEGLTERQTAAELGTTSVFVALGRDEGFGLPVAEALAAGCAVVGYPAGGGAELFECPGAHPVAESDILAIVEKVAELLCNEPSERERASYAEWVAARYADQDQRKALLEAVSTAFDGPGGAGEAVHPFETRPVIP